MSAQLHCPPIGAAGPTPDLEPLTPHGCYCAPIELRSLRYFVAVAEELHFGRAASRLLLAQQALSREIAKFERELGVRLFDRTTRQVALTADGKRLLPRAREILGLADQLVTDVHEAHHALVVDVVRDGSTAARVLERARDSAGNQIFTARFHGGFTAALAALQAGRVDVAFGRPAQNATGSDTNLVRRLVRLEPLALLVPDDHPFAADDAVPVGAMKGMTIDTGAGNVEAAEWVQLATELVEAFDARPSPDHHPGMAAVAAAGTDDVVRHARRTGWPILSLLDIPPAPGAALVPLVDPVPIYPWTMTHRRDLTHNGVRELGRAIHELTAENRWLDLPGDSWFAAGDEQLLREHA